MRNPTPVQALLCVLAAAFLWSTSYVATKIGLESFPPLTLAAARLTIATFLLASVLLWKREFVRPTFPDFLRLSAGGLLGITIYLGLENWGIKLASASDAALIVGSFPAITLILESLVYGHRLSPLRLLGAAVAMVGVGLIVGADAQYFGWDRLLGNALFLLTGISWAFYNFVTRSVVNKYPLMTTGFFQTAVATVCFYPLALWETQNWASLTFASLLSVIYLAVFCSIAALVLYSYGLRKLDSGSAVSLLNLVPVFGVLFAVAILGEHVIALQLIGGATVIVGVSISVRRTRSPLRMPS